MTLLLWSLFQIDLFQKIGHMCDMMIIMIMMMIKTNLLMMMMMMMMMMMTMKVNFLSGIIVIGLRRHKKPR